MFGRKVFLPQRTHDKRFLRYELDQRKFKIQAFRAVWINSLRSKHATDSLETTENDSPEKLIYRSAKDGVQGMETVYCKQSWIFRPA